jgi:hypothetical protein
MPRQIWVNLAVKDLQKSIAFFTELGFTFDPVYTNEKGTCMIVAENIFVMLLEESFFTTFTQKSVADTTQSVEALLSFTCESRAAVDALAEKALKAGGQPTSGKRDHGWMYQYGFADLDGHHWEPFYADPSGPK